MSQTTPDSILDAYFKRLVDSRLVFLGQAYTEDKLVHLSLGVHDELLAHLAGIEDAEARKKALSRILDRLEQTYGLKAELAFAAKVPGSTEAMQPELRNLFGVLASLRR